MKKKIIFLAVSLLLIPNARGAVVNFDLSNPATYSLSSNLTAVYDETSGILWLTHSNNGSVGTFTLEVVEDVSTFNSFTFGYNQTGEGNGGAIQYKAGNGAVAYQPWSTLVSSGVTIPGGGGNSTIGTGKFTVTINSGRTLQEGYKGHVGIFNFFGDEKEILPEGYVSIAELPFYNGLDDNGNPKASTASVAASGQTKGNTTLAGIGGTDDGDKFYDLTNYTDIQIKLTCSTAYIGKEVILRAFFMKADDPKTYSQINLSGTFNEKNTLLLNLDLTTAAIETRKLIGIKTQGSWAGQPAEDFSFNVGYVMVKGIPLAVEGITLNKVQTNIEKGKTETLNVIFTPIDATNKNVVWTSSDETVAMVIGGVVTAKKEGKATIKAKTEDGGFEAVCEVTVTPSFVPATGITLNTTYLDMEVGETATLTYTVKPTNASNSVIWYSGNTAVATVADGVVTALGNGTAYISVVTVDENEAFYALCEVTVRAGASSLNEKNIENAFAVYPTMVRAGFTVTQIADNSTLSVFDLKGKMVFSSRVSNNDYVTIEHLTTGFYIVKIRSKDTAGEVKIIKI